MLLRIDELSRPDHALLEEGDSCFYVREYTSREGYLASPNNQLVFNLKCPIDHTNTGRLFHKRKAIAQAAEDIAQALSGLPTDNIVFVPMPPSKSSTSPNYDPRVRDMLRVAEKRVGIRVVEAIGIRTDRDAAHVNDARPTVDQMAQNLIVTSRDWIGGKVIVIFDDVLVTGTQYKAAVKVLAPHDPEAKFVGIFWIRRVFP